MEIKEKTYEQWVQEGLKKAKEFASGSETENNHAMDLIRRIVEDAFYEGYMAAKEEKFNGKISII